MLIDFFLFLREKRIPVTITEYLTLLDALSAGLANCSMDDFYSLARLILVKNEAHYDRFDVAFGDYFDRIMASGDPDEKTLDEWVTAAANDPVAESAMAALDLSLREAPCDVEKNPADEEERIEEDSRLLLSGTGNSPMGQGGLNHEGIRLEGESTGNQRAIKAWNSRQFKGLDDEIELGTRNIKVALRRLRKFAREGTPDELDMEDTIRSTARNAGWLDLKMRPERRNKVKVLLLFDVGGSMTSYVKQCEELFSAAKNEFRHMEYFYFHNCIYDSVWKYISQSMLTHYPLHYLTNQFNKEYKLIIVGDATMGPTEITDAGDSFYRTSSRYSGETWMKSLLNHYHHAVWLNPEPEKFWAGTQSIRIIRDIMEGRMYPLTLRGLDDAMKELGR